MSFHHVDFDFSTPDNGMKIIDELLIKKYLLMLPEVEIKHSIIKSGDRLFTIALIPIGKS